MNKKQMMFLLVLCLLCFATSFAVAWLTRPKAAAAVAIEPNTIHHQQADSNSTENNKQTGESDTTSLQRVMSEKQLKLLVQSLRTKIADYEKRMQDVAVKEQRLNIAKESLLKDVNELNSLRVQVANETATLKQKQQQLEQYQIKITSEEQVNLKKTATIYDKMDVTSASKIFINMCMNKQLDDAVKIINYMTDRTAAKALGEIGTSDPKIAADLVQALKKLKET